MVENYNIDNIIKDFDNLNSSLDLKKNNLIYILNNLKNKLNNFYKKIDKENYNFISEKIDNLKYDIYFDIKKIEFYISILNISNNGNKNISYTDENLYCAKNKIFKLFSMYDKDCINLITYFKKYNFINNSHILSALNDKYISIIKNIDIDNNILSYLNNDIIEFIINDKLVDNFLTNNPNNIFSKNINLDLTDSNNKFIKKLTNLYNDNLEDSKNINLDLTDSNNKFIKKLTNLYNDNLEDSKNINLDLTDSNNKFIKKLTNLYNDNLEDSKNSIILVEKNKLFFQENKKITNDEILYDIYKENDFKLFNLKSAIYCSDKELNSCARTLLSRPTT